MSKKAKRVLLVDDKAENRYLLNALLTGSGFAVEEAINGEDALACARNTHPDLIISDILMPVMDGFTLCHEVKTDADLKDTAFVFYTASYLDRRDKELALNLGVDRYLTKPQEPKKLLEVFQEVLEESEHRNPVDETKTLIPENDYLREHNESLVRMLEKKIEQLNRSKKVLEAEIIVRQEAERQLTESLNEKDVLLKEVYHRTKNNMQVIVGLLDLQARKGTQLSVDGVCREMSDRIYSMSMVHDLLYRSKNLYEIKLDAYLKDLSNRLLAVYESAETDIQIALDAHPLPVNIQFAVPLGLVITEIITNSLKYGFTNRSKGRIYIQTHFEMTSGLKLTIGDDGVGLDDDFDASSDHTLGMYIIKTVVENQLYGELSTKNQDGLTYTLSLPDLLLEINTN